VADAQHRWAALQDELAVGFYRTREIEAAIACQPELSVDPALTAELHRLYKWIFAGVRLKGIAEAQADETARPATPHQFRKPLVEPIVIYQMGKVGSKTVEAGLQHADLPSPICHCHMLNNLDSIEAEALRSRVNPVETLQAVQHARGLRNTLLGTDYVRCRVVTMVRDPIARNISAFFQNIAEFIPTALEQFDAGDLDVNDVIQRFLTSFNHNIPEGWFDNQLKPVFGIDVFAQYFSPERGYAIYHSTKADLLVIKLEMLDACAQDAMREFLGLEHFELGKVNAAENKEYKYLYRAFLNTIAFPDGFVERMYESRLARHFYTDRELSQFKRRWLNKSRVVRPLVQTTG
jgi:hypothetical protein